MLSGAEKRTLADIVEESLAKVTGLVASLDSDTEDAIKADMVSWNTGAVADDNVYVESKEVKISPEELRGLIRRRNRLRLDLPPYSEAEALGDKDAIVSVNLCGPRWF